MLCGVPSLAPRQVEDVKAKIEETQGADFPAASLNVIYQGKVRWVSAVDWLEGQRPDADADEGDSTPAICVPVRLQSTGLCCCRILKI